MVKISLNPDYTHSRAQFNYIEPTAAVLSPKQYSVLYMEFGELSDRSLVLKYIHMLTQSQIAFRTGELSPKLETARQARESVNGPPRVRFSLRLRTPNSETLELTKNFGELINKFSGKNADYTQLMKTGKQGMQLQSMIKKWIKTIEQLHSEDCYNLYVHGEAVLHSY